MYVYIQYSDETAAHLARQLLDGATPEMQIVVVSAPSVFVQLKNLVVGVDPIYLPTHSTYLTTYFMAHLKTRGCDDDGG